MYSIHMLICRNPYFIGINSAIYREYFGKVLLISRNPYFIGINSAIKMIIYFNESVDLSQSLFYWN